MDLNNREKKIIIFKINNNNNNAVMTVKKIIVKLILKIGYHNDSIYQVYSILVTVL